MTLRVMALSIAASIVMAGCTSANVSVTGFRSHGRPHAKLISTPGTSVTPALPPPMSGASGGSTSASSLADLWERALTRLVQPGHQRVPGGCANLAGERVCVPHVSVDGYQLPDIGVLAAIVGAASNTSGRFLSLHDPIAIHRGIAAAVFRRLLYVEGLHDGIRVTAAQARALALQELRSYDEASPTAKRKYYLIPPGQTPRQYFLSARPINAYRDGVVVGRERDAILRHYHSLPPNIAFQRWFHIRLPGHRVLIDGHPPKFSLAAALPRD